MTAPAARRACARPSELVTTADGPTGARGSRAPCPGGRTPPRRTMDGRNRRARDHGDSLLRRARGQLHRGTRRSDGRRWRLPGLGGPVRRTPRRPPAWPAVREPGRPRQGPAGGRRRAGAAGHRHAARPGQHRGRRERHAPARRRPGPAGGVVRRDDPDAAGGRPPGADVHRLRSPVPGAPAHPRQGGRVQHAPAGHRGAARLLPGGPVVHAGAARSPGLERRPAAPHPRRAPPGGPAGLRGDGRASGRGLAGAMAAAGPAAPLTRARLAVGPPDGRPVGPGARRAVAGPPDPRPLLRGRHRAQAPAPAPAGRGAVPPAGSWAWAWTPWGTPRPRS